MDKLEKSMKNLDEVIKKEEEMLVSLQEALQDASDENKDSK